MTTRSKTHYKDSRAIRVLSFENHSMLSQRKLERALCIWRCISISPYISISIYICISLSIYMYICMYDDLSQPISYRTLNDQNLEAKIVAMVTVKISWLSESLFLFSLVHIQCGVCRCIVVLYYSGRIWS